MSTKTAEVMLRKYTARVLEYIEMCHLADPGARSIHATDIKGFLHHCSARWAFTPILGHLQGEGLVRMEKDVIYLEDKLLERLGGKDGV